MGVDPAVRITYHPLSVKTRSTGGTLLSVKTNYTTSEQQITVKNTRLSAIPRLLVKEQVPVSRDAKIKVNIVEPKSLSKKGGETVLKEGVSVRWASRVADEETPTVSSTTDELDMDSAQGMLEWICDIKPSTSVDLTLSWEISAPNGTIWVRH